MSIALHLLDISRRLGHLLQPLRYIDRHLLVKDDAEIDILREARVKLFLGELHALLQ